MTWDQRQMAGCSDKQPRWWRDRGALLLVGGLTLSMFGDSALMLTLAIWVNTLTGSTAQAGLTVMLMAAAAPFSPLFGWLADRVDRRAFLIVGNLLSAALVLVLVAVGRAPAVAVIDVVAFGYGLSMFALGAALNGLLKERIPVRQLAPVIAVLSTGREGLRLLSPLVGAGLFAVAGAAPVVVLDAVTFLVAAAAFVAIAPGTRSEGPAGLVRPVEPPREPGEPGERGGFRSEFVAGMRCVSGHPQLRQVVWHLAAALLVIGFIETALLAVVTQGLRRPPAFVGVLASVQGVGALAGGAGAAWLIARFGEVRTVGAGVGLFGVGTAALASTHLPVTLVGMSVAGAGFPTAAVAATTLIQRAAPITVISRVSAAVDLLHGIPQTVSIGLGAALIAVVDYRLLLAVITLTLVLISARLVAWPAGPQAVDTLAGPAPRPAP